MAKITQTQETTLSIPMIVTVAQGDKIRTRNGSIVIVEAFGTRDYQFSAHESEPRDIIIGWDIERNRRTWLWADRVVANFGMV